jgi:hypothetical protein
LFHQCEFREVRCAAEKAHERYLDSTHEVHRLEGYLGAVEVALEASEGEATTAQAVATNV